jgi:hypothetical protein
MRLSSLAMVWECVVRADAWSTSSSVHLVAAPRSHDVQESIFAIKEDLARLLVAGVAACAFVVVFSRRDMVCLLGNGVPHVQDLANASCSLLALSLLPRTAM